MATIGRTRTEGGTDITDKVQQYMWLKRHLKERGVPSEEVDSKLSTHDLFALGTSYGVLVLEDDLERVATEMEQVATEMEQVAAARDLPTAPPHATTTAATMAATTRVPEGEPDYTTAAQEIVPGLFLGPRPASRDAEWLKAAGITHIMCCAKELEPGYPDDIDIVYNHISLKDITDKRILLEMLPDAVSFIAEGLQDGKILVHCENGRNRSATCVMAYLMTARGVPMETALAELQSRRKVANPSALFQQHLRQVHEGKLKFSRSVSVPAPPSFEAQGQTDSCVQPEPISRSRAAGKIEEGESTGGSPLWGGRAALRPAQTPSWTIMEASFVECPHCGQMLEITRVACGTFRCGAYRSTMRPVAPHTPQKKCEELVKQGLIYGCGKPFKYDGRSSPVAMTWEEANSWY